MGSRLPAGVPGVRLGVPPLAKALPERIHLWLVERPPVGKWLRRQELLIGQPGEVLPEPGRLCGPPGEPLGRWLRKDQHATVSLDATGNRSLADDVQQPLVNGRRGPPRMRSREFHKREKVVRGAPR